MTTRLAQLAPCALIMAAAMSGGARAQAASQSLADPAPYGAQAVGASSGEAGVQARQIPTDFSTSRTALGLSIAQADALRASGVAQTSVDHQFARSDTVGSFGFLCGLQPSYYHSGVADARGYDPQGKFVGAKLAFAFK